MTIATDETIITWGKHKGKTLGDVPAGYLIWFADQEWSGSHPALLAYVNSKRDQLELEAADDRYDGYEEDGPDWK